MSNKTIAKFGGLVILFASTCGLLMSCSHASSSSRRLAVNASQFSQDYTKPVAIGRIESAEITESSGIAASLCQPDVLWTHNDSGDNAFIFAINLKGKHLGTWRVANARNDDWEDLASYKDAAGTCYLYIGDIGNNKRDRAVLQVYRIREPVIPAGDATSSTKNPLQTDPADVLAFKYSDTPHDAETLMVQPQTGAIYVLTKRIDGPSGVFKIGSGPRSASPVEARQIFELSLPTIPNGLLTGGAISPDGKRVVVCDYSAAYMLDLGGSTNFDDVWKQKPVPIDMGDRKQGEAVTFSADGISIIATSERTHSPVIEVKRK